MYKAPVFQEPIIVTLYHIKFQSLNTAPTESAMLSGTRMLQVAMANNNKDVFQHKW